MESLFSNEVTKQGFSNWRERMPCVFVRHMERAWTVLLVIRTKARQKRSVIGVGSLLWHNDTLV